MGKRKSLWGNISNILFAMILVLLGIVIGAFGCNVYLTTDISQRNKVELRILDIAEVEFTEGIRGVVLPPQEGHLHIYLEKASFEGDIEKGDRLNVSSSSNKEPIFTWGTTGDPYDLHVDILDKGADFQIKLGEEILVNGVFKGDSTAIYLKREDTGVSDRDEGDVISSGSEIAGTGSVSGTIHLPLPVN